MKRMAGVGGMQWEKIRDMKREKENMEHHPCKSERGVEEVSLSCVLSKKKYRYSYHISTLPSFN